MLSGKNKVVHPRVVYTTVDIRDAETLKATFKDFEPRGVFHMAAIARTPWCIDDPVLAYSTNVMGTLHVLEAARCMAVRPRVVLCSSNVVYAFLTPYRTSKEAVEGLQSTYVTMYGMSVCALRFSNVYGSRQSEEGPSPNVFAALRKSYKETGALCVTGDGEQTRNYTHVSDIVRGNVCAMNSDFNGVVDLCTGVPITLNTVARLFKCPVHYGPDRPGDVKHIAQSADLAKRILNWEPKISLEAGTPDIIVPRTRVTVLTNVYNEEYLLPFWLEHHRRFFDHGIVVDYGSTDKSLDIVRAMCPTWEIRATRNEFFDAIPIDAEFEDIEKTVEGAKIVLNTTEFILPERALASYFPIGSPGKVLAVTSWAAWATEGLEIFNLQQLLGSIELVNSSIRSCRFLHTMPSGAYYPGRHHTRWPAHPEDSLAIVWVGYHPWNKATIARKLQIKNRIGKDKGTGFGFQHFFDETRLQQEYRKLQSTSTVPNDRLAALIKVAQEMKT